MTSGSLQKISEQLGGRLHGDDVVFDGVSIDSRKLASGNLFVALKGEKFDGHQFVPNAAASGAAGAIVQMLQETSLPQVFVDDSRLALGRLASSWRQRFNIPVIAVTGSNGKTTVKEMLAAIMAQRGPVLSTRGNLNNEIGVPLTLMDIDRDHLSAVVEMGANHPGEIAYLTSLVQPTIGVISNASLAHLEGFGSPDGVARAKGELLAGLAADGTAIINADQPYTDLWKELAGSREIVSFGLGRDARFSATEITQDVSGGHPRLGFTMRTPSGSCPVELAFAGQHNVMNALAAAAAAAAAGAAIDEIRTGLSEVRPVAGRLQLVGRRGGGWLIDDTYNANPVSARAAMEFAAGLDGRRWLVLGDMAELGPDAADLHQDLGLVAGELGFEKIYTCGVLAAMAAATFSGESRQFESLDEMITALRGDLPVETGDVPELPVIPLIKASRSMRFDKVVDALCADRPETCDQQGG